MLRQRWKDFGPGFQDFKVGAWRLLDLWASGKYLGLNPNPNPNP